MTIKIDLSPEEQQFLTKRAAARGQDVSEYAHRLLRQGLMLKPQSIVETAQPFADAVTASGVSDEEFDQVAQQAIDEVRAARRARRPK
jgi:hypothetical protein